MTSDFSAPSVCSLCGTTATLEHSHIVPQFVYRWLKETSGTGYMRHGPAINRRVQDGLTRQMLCGSCEDLFSTWETKFSRLVFHPFVTNSNLVAKYDDWLLRFAVSVCWRILEEATLANRLGHFRERWATEFDSCRETWKRFLLNQCSSVGDHHIHWLRWDGIIGGECASLPPNINRYLRRTVEIDVPCSNTESFVYAKLGPLIFFGMLAYAGSKQWRGTRIYVEGKIKPRDFLAPTQYRDYIFSRARRYAELEGQISPVQIQKIAATTKLDRLLESGTLTALEMDYRLFGEDAFPRQ